MPPMRPLPSRWLLVLLLVVFAVTALLWAFVSMPTWGPDEGSHYEYAQFIVANGRLPIYGQDVYAYDPTRLQAHANYPPLYYLAAALVLAVTGIAPGLVPLMALRVMSIGLSIGTLALTYRLAREVLPARPYVALVATAVVGFAPMFTYLSATINSDNLINLVYAIWLCVAVRGINSTPDRRWYLTLGAVLGVGLITKYSIAPAVVLSAILLFVLAHRQPQAGWRHLVRSAAWTGAAMLLLSGWWFARNWFVYGDVLNSSSPFVAKLSPYAARGSLLEMLTTLTPVPGAFLPTLVQSFIGTFSYMNIYLPAILYGVVAVIGVIGLAGCVWKLHAAWRRCEVPINALFFACAALMNLIFVALYAYAVDYQAQGRYLFPSLSIVAIAVVVGWDHVMRRLRLGALAAPMLISLVLMVNTIALVRTLAPAEHERYIRARAARADYAPQPVTATQPVTLSLTLANPRAERLDVLISVPDDFQGNLSWELSADQQRLAETTQSPQAAGLALYRARLPDTVTLTPNRTYTLQLSASGTGTPPAVYAATADQLGLESAADLNMQVIYSVGLDQATFSRWWYSVRSAPPQADRTRAQALLYPLALAAMLVLLIAVWRGMQVYSWRAGLVVVAIVAITALCAIPVGTSASHIPRIDVTLAAP